MDNAQPGTRPTTYTRICRVKGCPDEGVPFKSPEPPLDPCHPRSHYATNHAGPGEVWSEAMVSPYLNRGNDGRPRD